MPQDLDEHLTDWLDPESFGGEDYPSFTARREAQKEAQASGKPTTEHAAISPLYPEHGRFVGFPPVAYVEGPVDPVGAATAAQATHEATVESLRAKISGLIDLADRRLQRLKTAEAERDEARADRASVQIAHDAVVKERDAAQAALEAQTSDLARLDDERRELRAELEKVEAERDDLQKSLDQAWHSYQDAAKQMFDTQEDLEKVKAEANAWSEDCYQARAEATTNKLIAESAIEIGEELGTDLKSLERLHARAVHEQVQLEEQLSRVHAECSRQVEEIRALKAAQGKQHKCRSCSGVTYNDGLCSDCRRAEL